MKKKKVYLTLQNGRVFQGYAFGAEGEVSGELVFNTGMVGYIEGLSDPSNYGQILVQTFPLIGNYGMVNGDVESEKAWVSAYVVREICDEPSNFRMEGKLEEYVKNQGVIGIYGVDTRELTKILRQEGAMNARISRKPLTDEEMSALANYEIKNAVQTVAPKQAKTYGNEKAKYHLALWNFGAKNSSINYLLSKDCKVTSVPATANAEEILALGVDGVILSDGPGNPAENAEIIKQIKKIVSKTPILATGLGYQMLALALGAETKKEKYGHRGSNQPVKSLENEKVYISTQNHGYGVVADSVQQGNITFVNVNDGACEGIEYKELNAIGVQFAPETCSAGHLENPVYDKFFALMKKENKNA
ncbi:MAG: carbamoyl phosphate synthase small subunit [Clostridia bacterium]|nr:carbamoyl phosphate synthase small subunit [Clostridia bacterium]